MFGVIHLCVSCIDSLSLCLSLSLCVCVCVCVCVVLAVEGFRMKGGAKLAFVTEVMNELQ